MQRALVDEADTLALKDALTIQKLRQRVKAQQAEINSLRGREPSRTASTIVDGGQWVSVTSAALDMRVGCSKKWRHAAADGGFRFFASPGGEFARAADALQVSHTTIRAYRLQSRLL